MDISKITRHTPSRDDVLSALGLEVRRSAVVRSVGLFTLGLAAGAGIALLLAPKTGRALRREIAEQATDLRKAAISDDSSKRAQTAA